MDVLIKGLELPKTENDNFMVIVIPTGVIDVVENGNGFLMQKKYEAIELSPHGRLVALDDVIELLGSGISLDTQADRDWAIELAERLPIIVEASNGTDN